MHPFRVLPAPASLRTPRLLLRPWRDRDFEPWYVMNRDPLVREHFGGELLEEASAQKQMEIRRQGVLRDGWGKWALEVMHPKTEATCFAGTVGISPWKHPTSGQWMVEGAWRLAHAHWGRGYATEAARAAIDFGFGALGLSEICAYTASSNTASQAVMARLGLHHQPELDFTINDDNLPKAVRFQRAYLRRHG